MHVFEHGAPRRKVLQRLAQPFSRNQTFPREAVELYMKIRIYARTKYVNKTFKKHEKI